jgi:hypothetical protein
MDGFQKLFEFRSMHEEFNPEAPCTIIESQSGIFALCRGSGGKGVLCVHNFSGSEEKFRANNERLGEVTVAAHGLRWIAFDSGGIKGELII